MSLRILSLFMTHIMLVLAGLAFAQEQPKDIRIDNSIADTVFYCNGPVAAQRCR
jgi:hypothetical protein